MFELHSNFATSGRRLEDGVLPTDHALHETLEITHGLHRWSEVGATHSRARGAGRGGTSSAITSGRAWPPDRWDWPVGASLTKEIGYQRRDFSADTWTLELRPIFDKQLGAMVRVVQPDARTFASRRQRRGGVRVLAQRGREPGHHVAGEPGRGVLRRPRSDPGAFPGAASRRTNCSRGPSQLRERLGVQRRAGVGLTDATEHRMVKLILGRRIGRAPEATKPDTATPGVNCAKPTGSARLSHVDSSAPP